MAEQTHTTPEPDVEQPEPTVEPASGAAAGQEEHPAADDAHHVAHDDVRDEDDDEDDEGVEDGERGVPAGHWVMGGVSGLSIAGTVLWQAAGVVGLAAASVAAAGAATFYVGRRLRKDGGRGFAMTAGRQRTGTASRIFGGGGGRSGGRPGGRGGVLGGKGRSGGGRSGLGVPGLGKSGKGRSGGSMFGGAAARARRAGRTGGTATGGGNGAAGRAAGRAAGGGTGRGGGGVRGAVRSGGAGAKRAAAAVAGSRAGRQVASGARAAGRQLGATRAGRKVTAASAAARKAAARSGGVAGANGNAGAGRPGRVRRWNAARKAAARRLAGRGAPWPVRAGAQIIAGLIALFTMWRTWRRDRRAAEEKAAGPEKTGPKAEERKTAPPVRDQINRQNRTTTRRNAMDAGFPIAVAAAELNTAATAYAPENMWVIGTDLRQLPDVFANVGTALRTYATRLQGDYPIDPQVVEAIGALYVGLGRLAASAQDIEPLFRGLHQADLVRDEAPRTNERAWNVQ